jgi:hypothetical protein
MQPRSTIVRTLWLIFAALQLVGPAAAAWADAQLEAESRPHAANHVEEHSTPHCPRNHSADCALCQLLTRPLVAAARPVPCPPIIAAAPPPPDRIQSGPRRSTPRLPLSRAPPPLA